MVLLQHLIDYVVGDVAADHGRYDPYIYGCFGAYTRNKQGITTGIFNLCDDKVPSYLSNIIMYSVTNKKEKETDNILKPIVLKIFPNLRFISISSNRTYSFSLNQFCSLYSEKVLMEHGQIQKVQITNRTDEWLKSQYEGPSKAKLDAQYESDFKVSLDTVRNRVRFMINKVQR